MQDMLQNKTQVETVNFRLYFKVIMMTCFYKKLYKGAAKNIC